MTSKHPTITFTALAFILALGAWALDPIQSTCLSYADEFSFWGLSNGKNVVSCILLVILGVYGLSCRPRFDLGREVLISLAIACLGTLFVGLFGIWHHLNPQITSGFATHLALSLTTLNAAFALAAAQVPLKGRWGLLIGNQLLAIGAASYEYAYFDKKYLLMSQAFLAILIFFSIIRVWSLSYSKYLLSSLIFFISAFVCQLFDQEILNLSSYLISGHSLLHLFWSIAGFSFLRFLLVIKPSDLNSPIVSED